VALLDEMFVGTNSDDLYDALVYCCRVFGASPGVVLFTTHSVAAARFAAELPRVSAVCLQGKWMNGGATFDYQLREGVSDERLGMSLLKNERLHERTQQRERSGDVG
jgi:DNA mismatch repair ATPase MutS